ncbi:MAG: alpha-1,2-fucosyltransferase [Actinomycetota bacterium]|nr:alpha-1,2-fucosyltransferase [Actinomycetota bacterium]
MITIENFGTRHGRLGNQMFQVAVLMAIEDLRGHRLHLPRGDEALWECFELEVPGEGPPGLHRFRETTGSCNFDPAVFEQPDGTEFHGYFQSYRYLEGIDQRLRRAFRFRERHRAYSQAALLALRRRHGRPLVAVHVRRGDYANPGFEDQWGDLARDGYYQRAVATIGDDALYLVFSDDVDWCRTSLDLGASCIEYVAADSFSSLCMMTGCDVNVVANSSFSWWGAYLNPAAEVYAPTRWFGPAMPPPNDRQDDIVPPHWRTVPAFTDVMTP